MKKAYLLAIIGIAALSLTRADIIPSISTGTDVTPITGGNFTWNYTATLTQDENVNTMDFFTIYDFAGFVAGQTTQPTGWTFTASLVGVTPSKVSPTDDPTLWNLTWTYTGTTTLLGPQTLGTFSAVSDTQLFRTGQFTAEATINAGDLAGTKIDNIGNVAVPVPEMSALLPMISVCGLAAIKAIHSLLRRRLRLAH